MAREPDPPDDVEQRKIVGVKAETVTNVTSTDFPGHYPGEDNSWSLQNFEKIFRVEFHKNEPFDASFSLIGIDASLANAFRRILIAEIPTLAIEFVFVHNNTSIIQDEVLAHRLGLVPLTGNLEGLNWMKWFRKPTDELPEGDAALDNNTIVLKLDVECTWAEGAAKGEQDPTKLYKNAHVYARDIKYEPVGRQSDFFKEPDGLIRPVNPDILLAKMRPGQKIDIEMHCIKGIGADHAKFSPVATASYRLMPSIEITKPILGDDARKFARCFPKGVIGLEDVVSSTEEEGESSSRIGRRQQQQQQQQMTKKAVVRDPFKDTVSRECLRHDEFKDKVKLGRVRDHFIFMVESTGQFESDLLFLESVKMLKLKCARMKRDRKSVV